MEGNYEFVIWVILIAIAAIFALVRKAIEKASRGRGEDGRKIDLSRVVQDQVKKYMGVVDEARRARMGGLFPGVAPPQPPPLDPRPAPAKPPVLKAPPPQLAPAKETRRLSEKTTPAVRPRSSASRKPLPAAQIWRSGRGGRLDASEARHAVMLAEILGPPVSERDGHRLF